MGEGDREDRLCPHPCLTQAYVGARVDPHRLLWAMMKCCHAPFITKQDLLSAQGLFDALSSSGVDGIIPTYQR